MFLKGGWGEEIGQFLVLDQMVISPPAALGMGFYECDVWTVSSS